MYLTDSSQNIQLRLYYNLLNQYLEGKKSIETKQLFDAIIKSTHLLVTEKTKGYEIDHSIYSIVLAIYNYIDSQEYNKMYFSELNPDNISDVQFKTLCGILSSLVRLEETEAK